MKWRSVLVPAALLCLAAPTPASAQSVKDALKVVPRDALGFVIVNHPGETSKKIAGLAKQFGKDLPASPLDMLKAKLGLRKSLDEAGSVVLAVLPGAGKDAEPVPIFFLPVTDYKEFLQELKAKDGEDGLAEIDVGKGEPAVVGARESYAVIAPSKDRAILKKVLAAKGDGSKALAFLEKYLTENDASGVLTTKGIKLLAAKARQGLEQAKSKADNVPPEAQFVLGWLDTAEGFIKSVESNVPFVAAGLKVDESGEVHARSWVLFKKGGDFAKAAAGFEAIKGGPLAGLPAEPFVVAFGGAFSEQMMKKLTDFRAEMLKIFLKDLPAEKLEKLKDAYAQTTKGLHGMSMMLAADKGEHGLFGGLIVVLHVEDATAYLDNTEKALEAVNEIFKELKNPLAPVTPAKRTTVAGAAALEITAELPAVGQGDEQKKLMEMMFGPGGKVHATLAVVNEHTLLARYTSPDGLKDLIKSAKKKGRGLAGLPEVATTMKQLPAGSQWMGFVSIGGAVEFWNHFTAQLPKPMPLPPFPKSPPIGYALRLSPAGLQESVVVPAETMQALGQLIKGMSKHSAPNGQ